MISFALAAAMAQASPATPPADAADDIVVIGRRLHKWRGRIATTIGITTCKTLVSTGDAEIDDIGCKALKTCWGPARPRVEAARDKHLSEDTRRQMLAAVTADLTACVKTTRDMLVAELADRRAAARKVGS